jgi:hypothetical protein
MDLTNINRIFHLATSQCTFFSASHRTFSNVDHILGYKASLNKHKKTQITLCILTDHSGIKLEINSRGNYRQYLNTWKVNNTLMNDQWVIDEIRREGY